MTLRAMLTAADHVWSVGTPSAVMGFSASGAVMGCDRAPVARNGAVSLRLEGAPRLLAFETISADPFGWNHGLALCVTARAPAGSGWIAGCGGDPRAIRPEDRDRPVWNMGCGDGIARVLFRPDEAAAMAGLAGRSWDEARPEIERLPGTWAVDTAIARIEQRHEGGPAPVLRLGTAPPATTPLPDGWLAAAHVFPPHPARLRPGQPAAFDPDRHAAFQTLLARHGRADLWALKQAVQALLAKGRFAEIDTRGELGRHGRMVIRVALRQALARDGVPPPDPWISRHDPALWRALHGAGDAN